jgi:hypothetical protein
LAVALLVKVLFHGEGGSNVDDAVFLGH